MLPSRRPRRRQRQLPANKLKVQLDASAEQVPDAVEGDSDENMDDDWRDQINTIMNEVDEVDED